MTQFRAFGKFRLDTQRKVLWHHGEPLPLPLKELELLCVLVERCGELVTKDELLEAVWAGSFVEENNLSRHIYLLRKALDGANSGQKYIETIPRRGYRFTAPVSDGAAENHELIYTRHTRSQTIIEESIETDAPPFTLASSSELDVTPQTSPVRVAVTRNPRYNRQLEKLRRWPFVLTTLFSIAVVAVVASAVLYSRLSKSTKPADPRAAVAAIRSIAVLPPRSLDGGDDSLPLSLGLADALITRLGSVQRLSVRPTSSVVRYVEGDHDAQNVGRSLGVDAILEGTLQQDGNGIRVTWRLIDVASGTQLWSGHFNEKNGDIFQLQDAVSNEVGEALFPNLSSNDRALLVKRQTTNSAAYAQYLKGNYFWSKRANAVEKSLTYYRKAIDLDPNFAQAYAGLAAVHSTMGNPSPEAESLIHKALQLDSTAPTAHATFGFIQMFQHWNWPGSERALDRAIALDPNSATAHHWKGVYLSLRGRLEEAKAEMRLALELDPLSLIVMTDLGQLHYFDHEYDQAIEYCNRALVLDKDFAVAHEYLADIYRAKGMDAEAAEAWIKRRFSDSESAEQHQRQILARSGLRGLILSERDDLLSLRDSDRNHSSSFAIAKDYLRLGDNGKALDWLEIVFRGPRTHWHPYLNVDPIYDSVRNHPRFQALLKQMNLAS